jgi:hypothetical protein
LAVETGISPSALLDLDPGMLATMVDVINKRNQATRRKR